MGDKQPDMALGCFRCAYRFVNLRYASSSEWNLCLFYHRNPRYNGKDPVSRIRATAFDIPLATSSSWCTTWVQEREATQLCECYKSVNETHEE